MAFDVVQLSMLVETYDELKVKTVLNTFTSINSDVEDFLRNKAVNFEKIGLSRTFLVFTQYSGNAILAGYFSISLKPLTISKKNWNHLSSSTQRKLMPMGYKTEQENYQISSILLGQIGKNEEYHELITGEELLGLSYIAISKVWKLIGGKILYLEVDNEPHLRKFYTDNGFVQLLLKDNNNSKKATVPYSTVNEQHLYVKKLADLGV